MGFLSGETFGVRALVLRDMHDRAVSFPFTVLQKLCAFRVSNGSTTSASTPFWRNPEVTKVLAIHAIKTVLIVFGDGVWKK
jgi:hypothetical protein